MFLSWNAAKSDKEGMCRQLKALEDLQLRECQLESLPARVFQGCDSLAALDLTYNGLTQVDALAFVELPNLKTLVLGLLCPASLPFRSRTKRIEDRGTGWGAPSRWPSTRSLRWRRCGCRSGV